MGVGYNPKIVTNGLVLCLDAANRRSYPGSGTTWTDLSGNGNNGTLTNGPTFSSGNGGSIVFDGTNDYVNVPISSSLQISQNITVSMWIYNKQWKACDYIEGGWTGIIQNGGIVIEARTGDGKIYWGEQYADPQLPSNIIYSELINVWYNIVGTYDGTALKLFYNAILDNSANYSFTFNNTALTIGYGVVDGYFNGNIGPTHIYNRALSAAEIRQNFNATRGRYGI